MLRGIRRVALEQFRSEEGAGQNVSFVRLLLVTLVMVK
jgi:hypothetical protein